MKRHGLAGLAIGTLLLTVSAVPAASAGSTLKRVETPATVTVNVRPVDGTGHLKPGYEVAARFLRAWCWTGSDLIPGAYRCSLGSAILDPCWPRIGADGSYHGSYCLHTPWGHAGVVLRGRHAPLDHRTGRSLWGVHTSDGYGCVASPGANARFHGQFLFWRCDDGRRWLLVTIDRSAAQWHATEVVTSGGRIHDAHRVGITKAWFGVSPFGLG
jgi:hypothetical protein